MTLAETPKPLDPVKFVDPFITAKGERRATVGLAKLETLWINTGTLCNITCTNCYIESSPKNDRLVYITAAEVAAYLDEIERDRLGTRTIGFTGGEPFMNPDLVAMLEDALSRGFEVLVLTNAMKPMHHKREALADLARRYGGQLTLRVSIDHYTPAVHEMERGAGTWAPMLKGLTRLRDLRGDTRMGLAVATRGLSGEDEATLRRSFARLFDEVGLDLDPTDPVELVVFPEMDETADVPEITEACWGILDVAPEAQMCATSRMVVKRKGADRPAVLSCTLLPYDTAFELGGTLAEANRDVPLNHPHCARFCVLGGASCGG
jgi:uncharacterized Fe-S cluster-containing radical SAM superfamily protein